MLYRLFDFRGDFGKEDLVVTCFTSSTFTSMWMKLTESGREKTKGQGWTQAVSSCFFLLEPHELIERLWHEAPMGCRWSLLKGSEDSKWSVTCIQASCAEPRLHLPPWDGGKILSGGSPELTLMSFRQLSSNRRKQRLRLRDQSLGKMFLKPCENLLWCVRAPLSWCFINAYLYLCTRRTCPLYSVMCVSWSSQWLTGEVSTAPPSSASSSGSPSHKHQSSWWATRVTSSVPVKSAQKVGWGKDGVCDGKTARLLSVLRAEDVPWPVIVWFMLRKNNS